jgi:uncharacterized membrane protein YgcG
MNGASTCARFFWLSFSLSRFAPTATERRRIPVSKGNAATKRSGSRLAAVAIAAAIVVVALVTAAKANAREWNLIGADVAAPKAVSADQLARADYAVGVNPAKTSAGLNDLSVAQTGRESLVASAAFDESIERFNKAADKLIALAERQETEAAIVAKQRPPNGLRVATTYPTYREVWSHGFSPGEWVCISVAGTPEQDAAWCDFCSHNGYTFCVHDQEQPTIPRGASWHYANASGTLMPASQLASSIPKEVKSYTVPLFQQQLYYLAPRYSQPVQMAYDWESRQAAVAANPMAQSYGSFDGYSSSGGGGCASGACGGGSQMSYGGGSGGGGCANGSCGSGGRSGLLGLGIF